MNIKIQRINLRKHPFIIRGEKDYKSFRCLLDEFEKKFTEISKDDGNKKFSEDTLISVRKIKNETENFFFERGDIITINDKTTILTLIYISQYALVNIWHRRHKINESEFFRFIEDLFGYGKYIVDNRDELQSIIHIEEYHPDKLNPDFRPFYDNDLKFPEDYKKV